MLVYQRVLIKYVPNHYIFQVHCPNGWPSEIIGFQAAESVVHFPAWQIRDCFIRRTAVGLESTLYAWALRKYADALDV